MSEREMRALMERLERQLGMSWADIVEWLRDQNALDAIEERLKARGVFGNPIEKIDAAAVKFSSELHAAHVQSGQTAAASLDDRAATADKLIRYDITNQHSLARAKANEYELVQGFTAEQRAVTRNVIADGAKRGANPRELARDLRDSIGLTEHQEQHVRSYRRALEVGDYGNALGRELRDGRSDRLLRRYRDQGGALTGEQIDGLTERYRRNYVAYRAETIARTESARAVAEGSADLYAQAISRGDVEANELVKEWHAGPRTKDARDDHQAMNGMTVGIGEDFTLPDGTRMKHPGDPRGGAKHNANCRCTYSVAYKAPSTTAAPANTATQSTEPKPPEPTPAATEIPSGFSLEAIVEGSTSIDPDATVRTALPSYATANERDPRKNVYVVRPSDLADRKLYGIDTGAASPTDPRTASILRAWETGEDVAPIEIHVDRSNAYFVADGNHRLFAAALAGDRKIAARIQAIEGDARLDPIADLLAALLR